MKIYNGKLFGVYFTETIDNSNLVFWNDVLINFLGETDLEKKIKFYQKYKLNFQTEYKPSIPFYFANEDFNKLLLYYEEELHKEGISEPYPDNENLLKWYIQQDLSTIEKSELSILDQRNYVTIHNRFKLNVTPYLRDTKSNRILYNEYLEKQILELYPQYSFSNLLAEFENKKVASKTVQIETTLKQIERDINESRKIIENPPRVNNSSRVLGDILSFQYGDSEGFIYDYSDYLEGYEKCKTDGFDHVPFKTKITLDYIKGKNIAWFEMLLMEMLKNILKTSENSSTNPLIKLKWTGQKNQLYDVLRQLKNDYEMLNNSYNELADFIKLYVVGFENTSKETIEKELKKDKSLPKPKRVKLDTPK